MLADRIEQVVTRRQLRDGDGAAIVELHRRVYTTQFDRNQEFVRQVALGVERQLARGWPNQPGDAVWLIERPGEARLLGSLALTVEDEREGRVRWFVLDAEVRGRGLGRALLRQLLEHARATGMGRLKLETFSALTAAAHLYRDAGFRVTAERARDDWGPTITYQQYELSPVA